MVLMVISSPTISGGMTAEVQLDSRLSPPGCVVQHPAISRATNMANNVAFIPQTLTAPRRRSSLRVFLSEEWGWVSLGLLRRFCRSGDELPSCPRCNEPKPHSRYEALTTLDDNTDGQLDGAELRHLALWCDANGNGISESGELTSLTDAGIASLSCKRQSYASPHRKVFFPKGMTLRNGTTRPTSDLILYPRK